MRQRYWPGIGAAIGVFILILDGKTAIIGGQTGIQLCLQTVIPSLFPFIFLSVLLTSSFLGTPIPLLRPVARFCKVPMGAESIFISSFLGGYPVGAQTIAEAYRSGFLSKSDAERMLAFCNNAGPSFLFGMVSGVFSKRWVPWCIWGIHITSALLVSRLMPSKSTHSRHFPKRNQKTISQALTDSLRIMASICGWVILFRIIITFLQRWCLWLLPVDLQITLTGVLELSNGCCELPKIVNPQIRFLLCSVMLAFGGVCVTMQTVSVTVGLSLHCYFFGKLMQTFFSILFTLVIIKQSVLPVLPVILLLVFANIKNKDSIPKAVGV